MVEMKEERGKRREKGKGRNQFSKLPKRTQKYAWFVWGVNHDPRGDDEL